jgi:drug/metabolite transporter (DMT)-like permease
VLVKYVDLPASAIALDRTWLGAAVFAALLYVRGGRLTGRVLRESLVGGIAFGTNILLFFAAVKLTTVTDATMISALQPVLVMFVARRRYREVISARDATLAAVSLAGVALVVAGNAGGGNHRLAGDVLAAGALITWAWYFVASKAARSQLDAFEYQCGLLVVAGLVMLPIALPTGGARLPGAAEWGWLALIALGPGGGHLLMNWAHAHVDLTVSSLLTLASPAITVVAAAIVLGESVAAIQATGVIVVLSALALFVVGRERAPAPPPPPAAAVIAADIIPADETSR